MKENNVFSVRLRTLRVEKGLLAKELAEKLGKLPTSVSDWETGKSFPALPTLIKIADILDCSLDILTGRAVYPIIEEENENPKWVSDLIPKLKALDPQGQKSVLYLVTLENIRLSEKEKNVISINPESLKEEVYIDQN